MQHTNDIFLVVHVSVCVFFFCVLPIGQKEPEAKAKTTETLLLEKYDISIYFSSCY